MGTSGTSVPEGHPSIWTPANIVTCVRIVFIPVFMVLCDLSFRGHAEDPSVPLAFAAFAQYMLLSLTDKVDGLDSSDYTEDSWAALQEAPKHRIMVAAVLQNQQALSALDQGKEIPLQRFLDHALYCLHKRHGSLKEAGILPPELTALPGPLPVIGGEGPAAPTRVLMVGSAHKYGPEKKPVQKLTEIKGIIHAVVYMKNHDIL